MELPLAAITAVSTAKVGYTKRISRWVSKGKNTKPAGRSAAMVIENGDASNLVGLGLKDSCLV
jgi:hypothetical protein